MIKQVIDVNGYWEIIVYYNVNYNLFDIIVDDMAQSSTPVEGMDRVKYNLFIKGAKAVTITFKDRYISYIIFRNHKTKEDYISSIVHEAEHVKESMLEKYNILNSGEPPAYTIGYIVKELYSVFNKYVRVDADL